MHQVMSSFSGRSKAWGFSKEVFSHGHEAAVSTPHLLWLPLCSAVMKVKLLLLAHCATSVNFCDLNVLCDFHSYEMCAFQHKFMILFLSNTFE